MVMQGTVVTKKPASLERVEQKENRIGVKSLFLTFLQALLALADSVTGIQTEGKMNTEGMFNEEHWHKGFRGANF